MQLSSRILTALAVLILAVAVVAVRTGSPGTVEAATGTIDVLNVGTCYTTSTDVFGVRACDDGDGNMDDLAGYDLVPSDNEPGAISVVGTVNATYSFDPLTGADSPRGILKNADLVKVSIEDTGRDKRTPVLLPVGSAPFAISAIDYEEITKTFKNIGIDAQAPVVDNPDTTDVNEAVTEASRDGLTAETVVEFTAEDGTKMYHVAGDMYWGAADGSWAARTDGDDFDFNAGDDREPGVEGLKVEIDPDDADEATEGVQTAVQYLPMHAGDGAVFKFYGWIDKGTTNNAAGVKDADEPFQDLGSAYVPDEDRGPGRAYGEPGGAVAPWLNVQVHNGAAVLQYVVYHTSEREVLAGGRKANQYGGANHPTADQQPAYTKDEGSDTAGVNDDVALAVRAKSDGNADFQDLWLLETGRFTGRYEGYVRLTDPDGDGGVADAPNDWGLELQNASSHDEMGGAAVLGVESGPVLIEYRDTDNKIRTRSIAIDTVPPAIQIDVPAHESRGRNTTPLFAGAYSDADSGLREESFRLYVDNTNDKVEGGGDDGDNVLALDLTVNEATDLSGYVADTPKPIRSVDEYSGFVDGPAQFGVLEHTVIFDLEETKTDIEHIEGDRHDDGAATGSFSDSIRIRLNDEDKGEIDEYNNTIDFHALVVDLAGNVGFSDSDDTGPRLINDYGKPDTGDDKRKPGKYNVLGWYARHIFFLDEKEPVVEDTQTVTGFYGINDSKKPMVNRSGILVAFDAAVDADTVGKDTFEVTLDPATGQSSGSQANVVDATVNGRSVYLLLGEELASNATPSLQIASGKSISDPAGNQLFSGGDLTGDNETSIEINDGIAPKLSVTLSGGSGTGEGNEGPDQLTNKAMTINIESDEEIHTTPAITAVCSNLAWTVTDPDGDSETKGLSDFTGARSGASDADTATFDQSQFRCGDGAVTAEIIQQQQVKSFSRPKLDWEFEWQNFDAPKLLPDGKVAVVAYGRDRRSYVNLDGEKTYSWGVATSEFNFDTTKPALDPTPGDEETITETRPFILLNYVDKSTVSIESFELDGTAQEVSKLGTKRFLYWPESMSIGSHDVSVEAIDAAGNKTGADEYSFTVAARKDFDLKLIAGWNAVSVPANPLDPTIDAVFTEGAIDMVAAWDASDPEKPWSIATRMEGEWSTHSDFATLTKITAKYGYWVHAQGFVTQRVALIGKRNRESADLVPPDLVEIPTLAGWNFVGVIDQEGDQTQDNFGDELETGDGKVAASSYLGKHAVRSYTWDAIRSRFDILEDDEIVTVGQGIWVYFGDGIAP